MTDIEYPDIRYVTAPIRLSDNQPTGEPPRMRHLLGCSHFIGDGHTYGTPVEASEEQMQTLSACKSCIAREFGAEGSSARKLKYGDPCPSCFVALPLSGECANCG